MIREHDKRGKVLVVAAKSVADPTANAREAGTVEAGGLKKSGLAVNAVATDHVVNEGDVVDDVAERSDRRGQHLAALAEGLEVPDRSQPRAESVLESFDGLAEIGWLSVSLEEFGLVIEEIDVTCATGHEELNDALGFGGMMRLTNDCRF